MLDATFEVIPLRLYGASEDTPLEVFGERDDEGSWTVLGVHGFGDNLTTWQTLRTLLRAHGARFVCADLPGHGRTPLPPGFAAHYSYNTCRLVNELVRRERSGRVLVIGNSMGGSLALGAAALDLESGEAPRIAGLVLCAPATERTRTPYFIRLLKLPTYSWLDALSRRLPLRSHRASVRALLRVVFRFMLGPGQRPHQAWFDAVLESLAREGAWLDFEAIARELLEVLRGEREEVQAIRAAMRRVQRPVVVLRGDRDVVIGEEELVELAADLAHARFESLPGIGHCPQNEAPEATVRAVLEVAREGGLLEGHEERARA